MSNPCNKNNDMQKMVKILSIKNKKKQRNNTVNTNLLKAAMELIKIKITNLFAEKMKIFKISYLRQ